MSKDTEKRSGIVEVSGKTIVPERDKDRPLVLEAMHLGIDFGGLTAVDEFNIGVGATEIMGLIGPNGAGKTTVFNLLTKVYQPTRGTILLNGKDTQGMTPASVNEAGIARTFQNIRLFDKLTVEENVKIGLHNHIGYGMFTGMFRLPKYFKEEKKYIRRERSYGKVQRSFYLGDINEENIEANFHNGTLHIIVPKKDEKETKKFIEVK